MTRRVLDWWSSLEPGTIVACREGAFWIFDVHGCPHPGSHASLFAAEACAVKVREAARFGQS